MLGKKNHFRRTSKNDNEVSHLKEQKDYSNENLNNQENQLLAADKNFNIEDFLEGSKKAFRIIVASYKENNIESAKALLAPKVLKSFQEASDFNKNRIDSFQITKLKASIVNIEVVKKLAKIKVKFLSTQNNKFEKKLETVSVKDIWTFEKIIESGNPNWLLTEVTAE